MFFSPAQPAFIDVSHPVKSVQLPPASLTSTFTPETVLRYFS